MPCEPVRIGNAIGIICIRRARPRRRKCSACGELTEPAQLRECDWKTGKTTTCDALICTRCSHVPAPEIDLCPKHAAVWLERSRQKELAL
jgi:hypothetical protein